MSNKYIEQEAKYGAMNYEPSNVVLVRGSGIYVWDNTGKKYMDMMGAYSAVSHGHCHPKLLQTLIDQAQKLNIVSRQFYTDQLGPLLERLCKVTGFERALPMNTGAEAVETALKAARKWAYSVKGVAKDQAEIIACHSNFHGRTISIISMSTVAQYKSGFGPLTPGFKIIPYGDASALENAITPNTAAFIVEPIQGEGGILVPPANYLKQCAEICKKHRVLLICDEIQTGLGRTGKLLAVNHENVQPDAMVLGKALGGGLLPISMFLSSAEVMNVFQPGDHGSTFGGNPLASAVALKAVDVLFEDNLIEHAAQMGQYFFEQLKKLRSPLIKDVRGVGLLLGIEIAEDYPAKTICEKLIREGILTRETHRTVIRLAPPLMVTKDEIDQTIKIFQNVLMEVHAEIGAQA